MATSLGRAFRPDDELAAGVYTQAQLVPVGERRLGPDAAFGPAREVEDPDPWVRALALLGRAP